MKERSIKGRLVEKKGEGGKRQKISGKRKQQERKGKIKKERERLRRGKG
jgi:hypothetical protein